MNTPTRGTRTPTSRWLQTSPLPPLSPPPARVRPVRARTCMHSLTHSHSLSLSHSLTHSLTQPLLLYMFVDERRGCRPDGHRLHSCRLEGREDPGRLPSPQVGDAPRLQCKCAMVFCIISSRCGGGADAARFEASPSCLGCSRRKPASWFSSQTSTQATAAV